MVKSDSEKLLPLKNKSASAKPPREVKPPKKMFIFIALGLVVAIAAIVITLFLTVWSKPGTDDFKQTQTDVNSLADTYDVVTKASDDHRAQLKKDPNDLAGVRQKVEAAITAHVNKVSEIESQKALRDKEVKLAFDAFKVKNDKTVAYVKGNVALQEVLYICTDVFKVTRTTDGTPKAIADAHKKQVEKCTPVLEKLKSSQVSDLSQYAKDLENIIKERQKTFDAVADKSMSQSEGSKKINEAGKAFNEKSDALPDKIVKARNDASVYNEFKALKDLLAKKVSQ